MSLLMDALKRAEESKQDAAKAITSRGAPAGSGLALEPKVEPSPPPAPTALPDLADHIDAVDADLAATKVRPPPRPATVTPTAVKPPEIGREAVRNSFAAKEPPASRPSRAALWATLGLLGAAALGIGGYVWYEVQGLGRSSLNAAPTSPRPPAVPAAMAPTPPVITVATGPALPPPMLPVAEPSMPPATPKRLAAPEPVAAAEPDSAPPATPVRLVKTKPEVDPALNRGYHSLQSGNIEAARGDYEQALRRDPKNVDALLGLAAIAQRQGRGGDAERYRQQALEADPKDAAAQAAVTGLTVSADPVAAESRLKNLLSAQPESGPLNFSLGNLYSRQQRWVEAQQAYFNAVAAENDNPDYLFNLAVSLDHLRQPRLAAQHYRLALEAAERRPAAFDRDQAKKRLGDLQP